MKPTTKQRVLDILLLGMREAHIGSMYLNGELVRCKDGWIPQWVFASIRFCGTTEGKRRLRELRNDLEITAKYVIEVKHEGHNWFYRIRERSVVETETWRESARGSSSIQKVSVGHRTTVGEMKPLNRNGTIKQTRMVFGS